MRLSACFCLLLFAMQALAQFSSAIQGNVTDASQSAVPEASVTVKNDDTGISRTVATNAEGFYRVSSLGPGTYTVTVQKPGFTPKEQKAVSLALSEVGRVDVSLTIGAVTDHIDVSDQVVLLETEQGRVSGRIEGTQIKELPINGRNILNLIAIQPGIVGRGISGGLYSGGGSDSFSGETAPSVYANGQRSEGNNYTLDDTSANGEARNGITNIVPNSESVEEIRVVANNFSAVDGRNPGAQVQMVTKAGTNQFHGVAAYYFTNNNLASRSDFDTVSKLPALRKHLYDFALGGPVIKNRTFFFASYEGLNQGGARNTSATVETSQFRDFVLQTRPNSIAATLLKNYAPLAYPTANLRDLGSPLSINKAGPLDGIPDVGTAFYTPAAYRNGRQISIRVDHELRPGKDRIYGTFFPTRNSTLAGGLRPAFDAPQVERTYFGNLNETHIFSSNKINEFRAGVIQLVGEPDTRKHLEVPGISISGASGFSGATYPAGWWQTSFDFKDIFSWVHGNHNLKVGGELRRMRGSAQNTFNYIPSYSFAQILDFANDTPISMTRLVNPATGTPATVFSQMRNTEWALFVQEDWKVKHNLTLNLGMRYEVFGTWDDKQNSLRNFIFGPGNTEQQRIASGKVDYVKKFFDTYYKNFNPRFGFSWDPTGKAKMTVRGGYGIVNDRMATLPLETYRQNPPAVATATLGLNFGTAFTYSLGDANKPYAGFAVDPSLQLGLDANNGIKGVRVGLVAADPSLRTPYVQNWFLGIQREFLRGTVLEVNYVGSAGHRLFNSINLNRYAGDLLATGVFHGFNPSFSSIAEIQSTSNSFYNGMNASLKHVFSRNFMLQGNYTFGRALDDTDGETGNTGWQDAWNRQAERALAGFDVRHRVNIAGQWMMPFFKDKGQFALLHQVLGGWQLSGITIIDSGTPINVSNGASWKVDATKTINLGGDYNADNSGGDRPNAPLTHVQTAGFSKSQFLAGIMSPSVFVAPPAGADGNLGRNVFRGPGYAQTDLTLSKTFNLTERFNATFRADAYNAFNRVNLNNPNMDMNSVNFGKSTSQSSARLIQLGLRIRF